MHHRSAFIRLYIEDFHTELNYDTLTLYFGENPNNRAMVLYEWSGNKIDNKHLFIPNDNLFLVFNTDKSFNASGFFLRYDIIEKGKIFIVVLSFYCLFQFASFSIPLEIFNSDIYEHKGIIHSKNYPEFLRTNIEYTWTIHMESSNEIEINVVDINIDFDHDYLQVITGK